MTTGPEHLPVALVRKPVKHLYLRILADGTIRVTAPARMDLDTIHAFVRSRRDWIERGRARQLQRQPSSHYRWCEGELHLCWGISVPLTLVDATGKPAVRLENGKLHLHTGAASTAAEREKALTAWYCAQVAEKAAPLIEHWQQRLNVSLRRLTVRRMKTRWGSCTPARATIRLSSELARKPLECLEYVVVHELVHLLEASHNHRFVALMDEALPHWRQLRRLLNGG